MKTKATLITVLLAMLSLNGMSQCPTGYTGLLCLTQITPQFVTVKKIIVTNFIDGGEDAFPKSTPDIYIKLVDGSGNEIYTSEWKQDADPSATHFFIPETPSKLIPLKTYAIYLYDYDSTSGSDKMGSIPFLSYSSDNKFPESLTLRSNKFSVKIILDYIW